MIHKKRGLGAGKVTGPGGKLEPGESAKACALREAHEELSITASSPSYAGELLFQFADGYKLSVSVFRTSEMRGEPTESEEAVPLWSPLHAIPYDRMWADDYLWFPLMLAGTPFKGRFLFDGDVMVDGEVFQAQ